MKFQQLQIPAIESRIQQKFYVKYEWWKHVAKKMSFSKKGKLSFSKTIHVVGKYTSPMDGKGLWLASW